MPLVTQILGPAYGVTEQENGCVLNLKDPDSGHLFVIPMGNDTATDMIAQLSQCLTVQQKRDLAPLFQAGLHLPGRDFSPGALGQNPDGPPR